MGFFEIFNTALTENPALSSTSPPYTIPAPVNPTRFSSRHQARCSACTIHHALHKAQSGHSARFPLIAPLGLAGGKRKKLTNNVKALLALCTSRKVVCARARTCGLASTGMCVLPATSHERVTRKGWRTTKTSAWILTKRCARTTIGSLLRRWWTWALPEHWNSRCIAWVHSRFLNLQAMV